jgi:hypothetical protein
MAITFEINWVCSKLVDLEFLFHKTSMSALGITIKKISSMENWCWENSSIIFDITTVQERINAGKIVNIELNSSVTGNSGIFIEKNNNCYEYCFWVKVEDGHDVNEFGITPENKLYLQKIYDVFVAYNMHHDVNVLILGMGFETTFCYDGDFGGTISKSNNIIVWIVSNSLESQFSLSDFTRSEVFTNYVAFEKRIGMIDVP